MSFVTKLNNIAERIFIKINEKLPSTKYTKSPIKSSYYHIARNVIIAIKNISFLVWKKWVTRNGPYLFIYVFVISGD